MHNYKNPHILFSSFVDEINSVISVTVTEKKKKKLDKFFRTKSRNNWSQNKNEKPIPIFK